MIVLVMPRRDYVPVGGQLSNWFGNSMDTTCSLAKLNFRVSTISDLWALLAIAYVAQYLTTMPPMAAAFFQGTIRQSMTYKAFGRGRPMQPASSGGGYPSLPRFRPQLRTLRQS